MIIKIREEANLVYLAATACFRVQGAHINILTVGKVLKVYKPFLCGLLPLRGKKTSGPSASK